MYISMYQNMAIELLVDQNWTTPLSTITNERETWRSFIKVRVRPMDNDVRHCIPVDEASHVFVFTLRPHLL